jgi:carbon monoxide dehydrogenase subunit G
VTEIGVIRALRARTMRMAVELDHPFSTTRSLADSYALILDLDRVIPCVEGGSVLERTGPDSAKAEIKIKMGAMSMTFTGTVEVAEQDPEAHRAVLRVKSREAGGQGYANATVAFQLEEGGGTVHTSAQISGKAASMGEGVMTGVLDALITDFTGKLGAL